MNRTSVPIATLRLLGRPCFERDGRSWRPAGAKTWAVLAYLLLTERAPSRARLTGLCFPDAEDPRAALRWTLADLRRLLGPRATVSGDPVQLRLPADCVTDVGMVIDGPLQAAVAVLDGELLEGLWFPSSAPLELWLACQRQRLTALAGAALETAAAQARAAGDVAEAARITGRAVCLDPFAVVAAAECQLTTVSQGGRP